MKDYITSLVQQSLNEYIESLSNKTHIVMMLTNPRANVTNISEHIESLSKQFTITLIVSEDERTDIEVLQVHRILTLEEISEATLSNLKETVDLIYCPSVSHGFVAKLSMLIDDEPSIWVVLQMLLTGKEVLLGTGVIRDKEVTNILCNSFVDNKVQTYITELTRNGVHFTAMHQAVEVIETRINSHQSKKPLLLAKHVENIVQMGQKEITIPDNSILTPMAKDLAKQLRIVINRENTNEKRDGL